MLQCGGSSCICGIGIRGGALLQILACSASGPVSANVPEKTAQGGTGFWVPATHKGEPGGAESPGSCLAQPRPLQLLGG